MKSTIVSIGKDALSDKEPILVLFGDEATEAIQEVSIVQTFREDRTAISLKKGDAIRFGEQTYTVDHVGTNVNENFASIGHATIVFDAFDSNHYLETSVYVSPHEVPHLSIGMPIYYQSKQL